MQYQNILSTGGSYPYPSHDINPSKKDAKWCMQYAKASYYDFYSGYPQGVFASNGGSYERNRLYALAKQPIAPYKKVLGVDPLTDNTWMAVNWKIRGIIPGYRNRVISKMMEQDYGIVATAIDSLAKTEISEYMAQMKAKLAVRELMLQTNPQLASHPLIALQSGDPLDLEELSMRVEMGEQFNRSKDAELAIELGMYENNYQTWRRSVYEDLFDYGVAGCKDWLGDDNKAKFRRCNPEKVVISYAKDATFSDIVHAGEEIDVSLVELATLKDTDGNDLFTQQELTDFAGSIAGRFGNPRTLGATNTFLRPYDKFKCKVFDIEFFTYNSSSYRDSVDENGNSDFRKADYGRGKDSLKYKRKSLQYVYKCKWIVGTDKCYDWGMCYDQKRSTELTKKAKTQLSYKFTAYNFYEMMCTSFMDNLIDYADDYQLTILKIQNFKNRAVPSGWWIDLDALENVAMNKGGKNMTPSDLLQMFFETGVLVGRSVDASGQPRSQNWKPVIPIENTAASELAMLYQDLVMTIQAIERITGFNDATLGKANSKTLVPGYELAEMSTNDALFPMAFAEEQLTLQLAEQVLCRMKQGLKKGKISGYAPYSTALNSSTLRFIELDGDISLRDHGIMLEKRTTQDQRAWLLQQMQEDIRAGYLDSSDAVLMVNTRNVKECQMLWATKVKRAKEQAHQRQMQIVQETSKGNMDVAAQTAQMEAQLKQAEYQFELQKENMRIMGEIEKERMKIESMERIAMSNNSTKLMVAADAGDSKIEAAGITAQAKVTSTHLQNETDKVKEVLAGEYANAKQEISNQKPQSTTKK